MANAGTPKAADASQKGDKPRTPEGLEMLVRVLGSTLALLSFTVVCVSGLLRGHSFGSVVSSSLVALAAGGAAGVLLAFIVRLVAVEGFHHHFTPGGPQPAKAAGGPQTVQAAGASVPVGQERATAAAGAAKK